MTDIQTSSLGNQIQTLSQSSVEFNSYAGVDIVAVLTLPNNPPLVIGELHTISYSLHRDQTPIRGLGHVNPIGFLKGPRTLAGTMIFTNFNEYFFYQLSTFRNALLDGIFPLADMLPPFDVVITFANEFGSISKLRIFGITILDEGTTMSIDDLITETTFMYAARGIMPMISNVTDANRFPSTTVASATVQPTPLLILGP